MELIDQWLACRCLPVGVTYKAITEDKTVNPERGDFHLFVR